MSDYEGNPVGCLYERYQSSGVSPLYEVTMKKGQAHAPIFEAILTVPEGHSVSAQGNSKKIAKNLAAKMMLDKLDGRVKDEEDNFCEQTETLMDTDSSISKKLDDSNNNKPAVAELEEYSPVTSSIPRLSSQPTAAASVATFYYRLQQSHGPVLDSLHSGDICLGGDITQEDYVPVLQLLAREQQFEVKFVQLESLDNVEQSLVQICDDGQSHAVTVCIGMGPFSKNFAARCALMYIKLMSARDAEQ